MMPTKSLLRSTLFTSIMSSPLLNPCLAIIQGLVNSKSALLNPGKNPAINYLLQKTVYNHFCAGATETEVKRTIQYMKKMGFTGVIMGPGREVVLKMDESAPAESKESQKMALLEAVEQWKGGLLDTLNMLDEGDYLNVKYTGAGPIAVEALSRGDATAPTVIQEAMREVCNMAVSRKARLWIDAEQQALQPAIDAWTINLMREFNRNGVVVLNTIQAYLKASADNVDHHLHLAQKEGWALGIKLVRGAYIAHDMRERIHDTKADTDRNYNHIVKSLVTRQSPIQDSAVNSNPFPTVRLFVASHNAETVRKAYSLYKQRVLDNQPTIPIQFGQLQGMADDVSCELLAENKKADKSGKWTAPGAFKCLCWGTTEECLHFLLRRAVENKGAVQRTKDMAVALRREVWRRMRSVFV
ncbi:hypothetical protein AWENTII_009326 [Aspergillus wentii]